MNIVAPLPPEILSRIIREQLRIEKLSACLNLRLVNKYYDAEVLHAFVDGHIFDRRFFRHLYRYNTVHSHFALRFLEAFVQNARRQGSRTNVKHNRTRRRRRRSSDSDSTGHDSDDASERSDLTGPRTEHLRNLLTSTVVMLLTNVSSTANRSQSLTNRLHNGKADEDQLWKYWSTIACNALVSLLGARDSLLFVASSHDAVEEMDGDKRHLAGKSAEFFALIAAAYADEFSLSCQYLDQFQIHHSRTSRWLQRLNCTWEHFAGHSSQREKAWLEVLAACLILAVHRPNLHFFTYLIDLEPGIFTPAFTYIRYAQRNVIEEVIHSHNLEYFRMLVDRGWCLTDDTINDHNLQDQYREALIAALKLDASVPERFEILRILLIMSQEWQRNNNFRRLLLQAAADDDVSLAQLMLNLLSEKPIKWSTEGAANFERSSRTFEGGDTLDVAEMNGSSKMVRFLLQHRKRISATIEESWSYINPRRAVGQIIRRGEPTDLESFREIVFAARNSNLDEYFVKAAGHLSTEVLAILSEHVDIGALHDDEDEIVVIEESSLSYRIHSDDESVLEGYAPRKYSLPSISLVSESESSARVPTDREDDTAQPTRGETALANALRNLNWRNARYLVEILGVRLSWGSIKGIDVWETNESGMQALAELRKLLGEHGMIMETRLIYAPVFHPGQATSSAELREHKAESVQGSGSRRSSDVVSDTAS